MRKIEFNIDGRLMRSHNSVLIVGDEDPRVALVEEVVQSVATDVEVAAGGVTLHLAAWMDPEHWADEWRERGVDDPHAFIAGLVVEEA